MFHYTYLIKDIETDEFYIGVRSSKIKPELDSYMGSMLGWKRQTNFNVKRQEKKILTVYNSRKEACESEKFLIENFIKDPLNRNYYIPTKGFSTYGMTGEKGTTFGLKHTKETKEKMREKALGRMSNKKQILDTSTGVKYETIKECWKTLYSDVKFGTFFHRLNNKYYKSLKKLS